MLYEWGALCVECWCIDLNLVGIFALVDFYMDGTFALLRVYHLRV